MMGTKIRHFSPLPDLSLDEIVPTDNFYRRLEERLDLSFVRELVEDLYAPSGRPSVDPVVFFKLELIPFFEDLRSERQLMEVVADRLSLRWYLGYDLHGLPLLDAGTRPAEGLSRAVPTAAVVDPAAKVAAYTCGQLLNAGLGRPLRRLADLLV